MNFDWKDDTGKAILSEINTKPFDKIGLYNYSTESAFTDKARMYFLKLPFAQKTPEECDSLLEAWMYILKNFETMDAIPAAFNKYPIFTDLGETARTAALNPTERRKYERSLKVYRDNNAILQTTAKSNYQRGGDDKSQSYIRRMFGNGYTIEDIAHTLGETIDTVKRALNLK